MTQFLPSMTRQWIRFLPLVALVFVGCSGGVEKFPLGKVTGKVTMKGMPVSTGTISLIPIAKQGSKVGGRPATCVIQPDGTFVASTYKEGDGATVGMMMVVFNPPPAPEPGPVPDGGHAETIPNPFAGITVGVNEIEIKAGDNNLTVELVKN